MRLADNEAPTAWPHVLQVMLELWPSFVQRCAEHGLPPTQAQALLRLTGAEPLRMRDLADALGLDPSTVTGVVDRLEARGLVRRVPGPDRRARLLAVTDDGRAAQAALVRTLMRPPVTVAGLGPEQQARIAAALTPLERAQDVRNAQ